MAVGRRRPDAAWHRPRDQRHQGGVDAAEGAARGDHRRLHGRDPARDGGASLPRGPLGGGRGAVEGAPDPRGQVRQRVPSLLGPRAQHGRPVPRDKQDPPGDTVPGRAAHPVPHRGGAGRLPRNTGRRGEQDPRPHHRGQEGAGRPAPPDPRRRGGRPGDRRPRRARPGQQLPPQGGGRPGGRTGDARRHRSDENAAGHRPGNDGAARQEHQRRRGRRHRGDPERVHTRLLRRRGAEEGARGGAAGGGHAAGGGKDAEGDQPGAHAPQSRDRPQPPLHLRDLDRLGGVARPSLRGRGAAPGGARTLREGVQLPR